MTDDDTDPCQCGHQHAATRGPCDRHDVCDCRAYVPNVDTAEEIASRQRVLTTDTGLQGAKLNGAKAAQARLKALGVEPWQIRHWAAQNDIRCSLVGVLSRGVIDLWEQANARAAGGLVQDGGPLMGDIGGIDYLVPKRDIQGISPIKHFIHDPFAVVDEAGVWHAECTCGQRWERQACVECSRLVPAMAVARGVVRCGWHGAS